MRQSMGGIVLPAVGVALLLSAVPASLLITPSLLRRPDSGGAPGGAVGRPGAGSQSPAGAGTVRSEAWSVGLAGAETPVDPGALAKTTATFTSISNEPLTLRLSLEGYLGDCPACSAPLGPGESPCPYCGADPGPIWRAGMDPDEIDLAPGGEATAVVWAEAPPGALAGSRVVLILAATDGANRTESEVAFVVTEVHDIGARAGTANATPGETIAATLILDNRGNVHESFTLHIEDAPAHWTVRTDPPLGHSLRADPFSATNATVIIGVWEEAVSGNYSVVLLLMSPSAQIRASVNVTVPFLIDLNLTIDPAEGAFPLGGQTGIVATVRNDGYSDAAFDLDFEGVEDGGALLSSGSPAWNHTIAYLEVGSPVMEVSEVPAGPIDLGPYLASGRGFRLVFSNETACPPIVLPPRSSVRLAVRINLPSEAGSYRVAALARVGGRAAALCEMRLDVEPTWLHIEEMRSPTLDQSDPLGGPVEPGATYHLKANGEVGTFRLNVLVGNLGRVPAASVNVSVTVDNREFVETVRNVGSGQLRMATFSFDLGGGRHRVIVVVDPEGSLPQADREAGRAEFVLDVSEDHDQPLSGWAAAIVALASCAAWLRRRRR